jgi:hypothetical protein
MNTSENQGRQEILYRFAARKALQDLRNSESIENGLLQLLNAYPVFNYCRVEITENDKTILCEMAANEKNELLLRRFCLKLLRQFEQHQDIKSFFYDLWKKSSDYEIKLEVLWSLLGYNDLSEDIYADISKHFDAVNWDKWLPLIVEKLEGDTEEKTHVKELMKRYFNL